MPKFKYQAKKSDGNNISGLVEADSQKIALSLLKDKGYLVYSLNDSTKEFDINSLIRFNRVSDTERVNFTQNLAVMLSSGLPLSEGLEILLDQAQSARLKEIIGVLIKDTQGGKSLSESMQEFPDVFKSNYISLVKSGEASGKLDDVLKRLATTLDKDRQFKAKVKGAMLYPAIIFSAMLLVVSVLIIFVVPKLTEMFSSFNLELPLSTKILIAISSFAQKQWYIVLGGLVLLFFGIRQFNNTKQGSYVISRFTHVLPIFGKLLKDKEFTEFTRSLALLMASGVSIVDSLVITRESLSSPMYRDSVSDFIEKVKKGEALSSAILADKQFPSLIGKMLRVGEETGKSDEMLLKICEYFEESVDRKVAGLSVAIEPIVLVVLGVIVGGIIISVITPIYKLTSAF
ncbi:type II secretion system F family protein [Patescibacteria group bacterium]|nr:type II secretion system F family protein [Patescibacteria group bacterium]